MTDDMMNLRTLVEMSTIIPHFFEHGGNVTVGGKRKSACIVGLAGVRKVSMARRNPGMVSHGLCAAAWRTCASSPS